MTKKQKHLIKKEKKEIQELKEEKKQRSTMSVAHSGTDRVARYTKYADRAVHNSDMWVQSVLRPFEVTGQRYPSGMSDGTDVSTLRREGLTVPSQEIGGAGTKAGDLVGGVVFNASLENHYWTLATATDALGDRNPQFTWTSFHSYYQDSLKDIVSSYRVTSLGVRLCNTAQLLERQGFLIVGHLPPEQANITPETGTSGSTGALNQFSLMEISDHCQTFDLASLPSDLEVIWLPLTGQAYAAATDESGLLRQGITPLALKSITTVPFGNRIAIMWYATGAGANTRSIEMVFDVVLNIEFVPHQSDEYLFRSRIAPGSTDAIGVALETAQAKADSVGSNVFQTGVKVGKALVKGLHFAKGVHQILKAGMSSPMTSSIASALLGDSKEARSRPEDPVATPQPVDRLPGPVPHRSGDWDTVSMNSQFTVENRTPRR